MGGFVAIYHGGGYNYRLCKVPSTGKKGLTEECFSKNILKFADDVTYWRDSETSWKPGTAHNPWWRPWKTEKKTDVRVGTTLRAAPGGTRGQSIMTSSRSA